MSKKEIRLNHSENRHVRLPHFIILSGEFKALMPAAKVYMLCIQTKHYPTKYTSYGSSEAMRDTGFSNTTITKITRLLIKTGFLILVSNYNHAGAKVRTWELTWMEYFGKRPKDTWRWTTHLKRS